MELLTKTKEKEKIVPETNQQIIHRTLIKSERKLLDVANKEKHPKLNKDDSDDDENKIRIYIGHSKPIPLDSFRLLISDIEKLYNEILKSTSTRKIKTAKGIPKKDKIKNFFY